MKSILFGQTKLFYWAVFLMVLSLVDTVFTDFGLRNGYIEEANPIMNYVYQTSKYAFYTLKISLPLLLLFLLTEIKPKRYFGVLIGSALALYIFVFCKHVFWLSLSFQGN